MEKQPLIEPRRELLRHEANQEVTQYAIQRLLDDIDLRLRKIETQLGLGKEKERKPAGGE